MPTPTLLVVVTALTALIACTDPARADPPVPPSPMLARVEAPWLDVQLAPPVGRFNRPLLVTHAGDGSKRVFVVEQTGRVRVVRVVNGAATIDAEPFMDVRKLLGSADGEQGLLGLAFHPKFKDNRRFFFAYTDKDGDDAYAEMRASADGARADPTTFRPLFAIEDFAGNHNGGHVVFGPDGLLYLGTGDGGGGGDPERTAQNPKSFLGKMLTLDVNHLPPVGTAATPTVVMRGLRNPWRYAFDKRTGDLFIGDVGQNIWEEIDVVDAPRMKTLATRPLDFGWSKVEGAHCFRPEIACDAKGTEPVVFEYAHGADGCSVTGGVVADDGTYLFGDYCSGRVWTLARTSRPGFSGGPGSGWRVAMAADTDANISSFGEDEAGGLWLVDHGGEIRAITLRPTAPSPVPAPVPAPVPVPR